MESLSDSISVNSADSNAVSLQSLAKFSVYTSEKTTSWSYTRSQQHRPKRREIIMVKKMAKPIRGLRRNFTIPSLQRRVPSRVASTDDEDPKEDIGFDIDAIPVPAPAPTSSWNAPDDPRPRSFDNQLEDGTDDPLVDVDGDSRCSLEIRGTQKKRKSPLMSRCERRVPHIIAGNGATSAHFIAMQAHLPALHTGPTEQPLIEKQLNRQEIMYISRHKKGLPGEILPSLASGISFFRNSSSSTSL